MKGKFCSTILNGMSLESINKKHSQLVCAVVVLYFPDQGIKERLRCIENEVDAVVVVDNSSPQFTKKFVDANCTKNIHYICNGSNLGIAAALNQGLRWAGVKGYGWVILFDQDSEPMKGLCSALFEVYDTLCMKGEKVLVGANFINGLGHTQISCNDPLVAWCPQKTIITSGTLLSLDDYESIGAFRNEFFIDAVDHDYCLRAADFGFKVVVTCQPLMYHAIGAQSRHKLPWKKTASSNHSSLRRYYIFRNTLILIREYCFKEPRWAMKSIYYLAKTFALVTFFEKHKIAKVSGMITGILHAVLGRMKNVSD